MAQGEEEEEGCYTVFGQWHNMTLAMALPMWHTSGSPLQCRKLNSSRLLYYSSTVRHRHSSVTNWPRRAEPTPGVGGSLLASCQSRTWSCAATHGGMPTHCAWVESTSCALSRRHDRAIIVRWPWVRLKHSDC